MNCPKCHAAMEKVAFAKIQVDRCTHCRGIWFDSLEKEKLAALPGSEAVDIGEPNVGKLFNQVQHIDCPVCHGPMVRMVDPSQPHIYFESCTVCYGAFFDAGEFKDFKDHSIVESIRNWWKRRV